MHTTFRLSFRRRYHEHPKAYPEYPLSFPSPDRAVLSRLRRKAVGLSSFSRTSPFVPVVSSPCDLWACCHDLLYFSYDSAEDLSCLSKEALSHLATLGCCNPPICQLFSKKSHAGIFPYPASVFPHILTPLLHKNRVSILPTLLFVSILIIWN